jgi:hypothetical protein
MRDIERKMIGHGAIVLIFGLLAGFALTIELLGGIEFIPTKITEFELPGDTAAWARTHVGGILNAVLLFSFSMLSHLLNTSIKVAKQFYWMIVGAAYANTIFYWGGLLSGGHRALSLGDNRLGETSLIGFIGFFPAFIFSFVTCIAAIILIKEAFKKESS